MKRFLGIVKFIGFIVLIVVINRCPNLMITFQKQTPDGIRWAVALFYIMAVCVIIARIWKGYAKKLTDKQKQCRFTWKDFGIAVVFAVIVYLSNMFWTLIIRWGIGASIADLQAINQAGIERLQQIVPLYFFVSHIMLTFFAPIIEELIFRGYFHQTFFKGKGIWPPLLVSSFIFAILHTIIPIVLPIYFSMGALFFLAYYRRKNILDSIAVHMLNNSLVTVISMIYYFFLR